MFAICLLLGTITITSQFMSLFCYLVKFVLENGPGIIVLAHYGAKAM